MAYSYNIFIYLVFKAFNYFNPFSEKLSIKKVAPLK